MNEFIFILISLVSTIILTSLIVLTFIKKKSLGVKAFQQLEVSIIERTKFKEEIDEKFSKLIPFDQLKDAIEDTKNLQVSLKLEKGRVSITKTEIEVIDNRLRELEEIERELVASSLETQEELKVLNKKEQVFTDQNSTIKTQIELSNTRLDSLVSTIEESSQLQIQMDRMMGELLVTQSKIDLLLLQIEEGNEQYIKFKERYNALDIEYAQLYEKFSDSESSKKE